MGSAAADIGLDLKLCAMRTVGGFLREAAAAAAIESGDGRVAKLEDSVRNLEEERRKIEAFKRELPLCMLLLTDVIEGLKKELERCRGERFAHAFEEFIPIKKSKREEEGGLKQELDCKKNWMSSVHLWSDNPTENNNEDEDNITEERNGNTDLPEEKESSYSESKSLPALVMNSKEELKPRVMLPDLSLLPPSAKNASCPVPVTTEDQHTVGGSGSKGVGRAAAPAPVFAGARLSLQVQQQPPRKARRCWSPELHRRFVMALYQLGGPQVATPKQIRELMKVDGLTNDEVKSHLQKYRLHARKVPNASAVGSQPVMVGGLWVPPENYTTSPQQSASQSGSPQSPLQLASSNRAVSATAGDSCEEEDGKSESYNWK